MRAKQTQPSSVRTFEFTFLLVAEEYQCVYILATGKSDSFILMESQKRFQLVPVVFHKSANGVKVDPSAEDCASLLEFGGN
ncbi:hypothetical protein Pint_06490 [Pistacia integerrima]|uniref:Uncharacterized protein n=1 Tax=Pistacia integerrima TaxID=434235 RepID=A0ACC0Z5P7_9ROSI|nr:hypothetical protein Pint_06490 [Pistacia integerrima]